MSLVSVNDPTLVYQVNIVEISNTNGKEFIKVMFGGALSGNYSIVVLSQQYGYFVTTGVTFQAVGKVTSYYPSQGSLNGGTLITINGYNFSNGAITDNPVRVGYTDCIV